MKNIYSEDAFTGLEAAIVLIAFVVVAAVFSYVVLGAGFFTTQTAQATVHTGVAQASSSLEIVGNVMGISADPTAADARLTYINTSVALTAGGTAMDLTTMVVSYSDNNGGRNPSIANNAGGINDCTTGTSVFDDQAAADQRWCVSQKINDLNPTTPNNLLEPNEIWILSIGMPPSTTVNTKITVNMQPSVGAVLPITRTIPGGLNTVQALY